MDNSILNELLSRPLSFSTFFFFHILSDFFSFIRLTGKGSERQRRARFQVITVMEPSYM